MAHQEHKKEFSNESLLSECKVLPKSAATLVMLLATTGPITDEFENKKPTVGVRRS